MSFKVHQLPKLITKLLVAVEMLLYNVITLCVYMNTM